MQARVGGGGLQERERLALLEDLAQPVPGGIGGSGFESRNVSRMLPG